MERETPPNLKFHSDDNTDIQIIASDDDGIRPLISFEIFINANTEREKYVNCSFDIATAQALKKHLGWVIAHAKSIKYEQ